MDDFARLSPKDRTPYFETAAANAGLGEHIIEKDFWVCWTLKRLFALPALNGQIIFKGGTSLSKVFQVIERFSEDIDISISKELLGFSGDKDPEHPKGSKERNRRLEELSQACRTFVQTRVKTDLEAAIQSSLGSHRGWKLEIDSIDDDGQTLLFEYPTVTEAKDRYIRPVVKIEIGARSDQWPANTCVMRSYLSEHVADVLTSPEVSVKALDAARTFWEKATILHAYAHYPADKIPAARQSRHYYDFYKLLQSKHKAEAVADLGLLARVDEHKSVYFRAAWAKYDEAKKGTLKLVPGDRIEDLMRRDYEQMQEMFFNEPPRWDILLAGIREFEKEFNS